MKLAVIKELYPGERRVAITPGNVPQLIKLGYDVVVQSSAGVSAGFPDEAYLQKGASIETDFERLFSADIIAKVRAAGADAQQGQVTGQHLRAGQILIGSCDPLGHPQVIQQFAQSGATVFALELVPRITRAQSMDILSSQATIAGYRAVLISAIELPKLFPMMMTAAGTLTAARVFVIGAGVAGLQAIATAKKLGAVVQAYDVRPACREQVQSVGGKFVELPLESASAEGKGGYAQAQDEDFYRKQRALMAAVVSQSDVVITTAAIPGKTSPILITADAVRGMPPGGVIVDLAAERGGNCELTVADQRVVQHGITILGPTNLPSEIPNHASQMLGNNLVKFIANLFSKGEQTLNRDDEIVQATMVTDQYKVTCPMVSERLG